MKHTRNDYPALEAALRPHVEKWEVEDVISGLRQGLYKYAETVLARAKIMKLEAFEAYSNGTTRELSRYRSLSYWYEIHYPKVVHLQWKVKLDLARRWREALTGARVEADIPPTPEIEKDLATLARDALKEADYTHSQLVPKEVEEKIEDRIFQDIDVIETSTKEIGPDGDEEDVAESMTPEVHFDFSLEGEDIKVGVTPAGAGAALAVLDFKVQVRLRKVVTPWDYDFGRSRYASVVDRVAARHLNER